MLGDRFFENQYKKYALKLEKNLKVAVDKKYLIILIKCKISINFVRTFISFSSRVVNLK